MRKQIRMITYLPYYHLDAAFDNGLRKDYGNSEIRYDHFYYKEKKLSFTRQEFCNAHQFIDLRLTLEKDGSGCLSLRDNLTNHSLSGRFLFENPHFPQVKSREKHPKNAPTA